MNIRIFASAFRLPWRSLEITRRSRVSLRSCAQRGAARAGDLSLVGAEQMPTRTSGSRILLQLARVQGSSYSRVTAAREPGTDQRQPVGPGSSLAETYSLRALARLAGTRAEIVGETYLTRPPLGAFRQI